MFERFTTRAGILIANTYENAAKHGAEEVEPERLLASALGFGRTNAFFESLGVDTRKFKREMSQTFDRSYRRQATIPFSDRFKDVIRFAWEEAQALGSDLIDIDHIVLGLIREDRGMCGAFFEAKKVTLDKALAVVTQQPPVLKANPTQPGVHPNRPFLGHENPFRSIAFATRRQFLAIDDALFSDQEVIIATLAHNTAESCKRVIDNNSPATPLSICIELVNDHVGGSDSALETPPQSLQGLFDKETPLEEIAEAIKDSILKLGDAPTKEVAYAWIGSLKAEIEGLIPVAVGPRANHAPILIEIGGRG